MSSINSINISAQYKYLNSVKYSKGLSDHDYEVYEESKKCDDIDEASILEKLEEEVQTIREYVQSVYYRTASRGDQILTKTEREKYNKYKEMLPKKEAKLAEMKDGKSLLFTASA